MSEAPPPKARHHHHRHEHHRHDRHRHDRSREQSRECSPRSTVDKGLAQRAEHDDFHTSLHNALEELRVHLSLKHELVLQRVQGAAQEDAVRCFRDSGKRLASSPDATLVKPVAPPEVRKAPTPPTTSPKRMIVGPSSSIDFLAEERRLIQGDSFAAVVPEKASNSARAGDSTWVTDVEVSTSAETSEENKKQSTGNIVSFSNRDSVLSLPTPQTNGTSVGGTFSGTQLAQKNQEIAHPLAVKEGVDSGDSDPGASGDAEDNGRSGGPSEKHDEHGVSSSRASSRAGSSRGSLGSNASRQASSEAENDFDAVGSLKNDKFRGFSGLTDRQSGEAGMASMSSLGSRMSGASQMNTASQRWRTSLHRVSLISTTRAILKKTRWRDEVADEQGCMQNLTEPYDEYTESSDDDEEFEKFHLCPAWIDIIEKGIPKQRNATCRDMSHGRGTLFAAAESNISASHMHEISTSKIELLNGSSGFLYYWTKAVLHPSGLAAVLWNMLGISLFCYDAIVIPLQFFDPPESDFVNKMTWIVRIYWTFDIGMSFLIGDMLGHGQADLNPLRIARRYMRSWLCFDITIVALDWSELFGGLSEFTIARVGKLAKSVRMLRMFRAFKLMSTIHVPEQLKGISYYLKSERLLIFLGIFRIIVFVIWTTHFIACFWYGLGKDGKSKANWVDMHKYARAELGYLYATSFHWSLTQFTGSMDIQAHNIGERIYSISVLLVAFIISAYAVSSITTSMTRLELVSTQTAAQNSALRGFLTANNVSKVLAYRIQRSANELQLEQKRNKPEKDVELLSFVSEPLKVELHYELYADCFSHHPFFVLFDQVYTAAMRQVCHSAVERHTLSKGDVLFSSGELPEVPVMYFINSGRMTYFHENRKPKNCRDGHWACEASLWTLWACRGGLRAQSDCYLLKMEATRFQRITCQFISREANPINYGKLFLLHINQVAKADLTDLVDRRMDLQDMSESMLDRELLAQFKECKTQPGTILKSRASVNSNARKLFDQTLGFFGQRLSHNEIGRDPDRDEEGAEDSQGIPRPRQHSWNKDSLFGRPSTVGFQGYDQPSKRTDNSDKHSGRFVTMNMAMSEQSSYDYGVHSR